MIEDTAVTDATIARLAGVLVETAGPVVALSGAGVSVDSDIPAFRGDGGLWDRYDPMEYATLSAFRQRPREVWRMLAELDEVLDEASPNPAHEALADLERIGVLDAVITQNVDALHQAAGNGEVVEVHGSRTTLTCVSCEATVPREDVVDEVRAGEIPRCRDCGELLKPDVVFFGEMLPPRAIARAEELARACTVMLVVGTSAEVHPVAELPRLAATTGAQLWEINPDPAIRRAHALAAPAEDALPALVEAVRRRLE